MSAEAERVGPVVRLVDVPGEQGRTTVTLLGSLAARLATLPAVSGSDAVGSLAAGYGALGRSVATTAEGALLRRRLRASRAGANGDAVWSKLGIGSWVGSLPPAAVLQQLANDLALLAAEDLDHALELPLAPAEPQGADDAARPAPVEFADYLLGLWAFSTAVLDAVDALLADPGDEAPTVERGGTPSGERTGPLLR